MKIVIFGVGKFYQEKKDKIPPNLEIVAFLDNNVELQGRYKDGIEIFAPNNINEVPYDKILLMSICEEEMKHQLLDLGIAEKKIWYWDRFISEIYHGNFKFYCGNNDINRLGKRVLLISTELGYNGGTLAAVYAAKALQSRGNNVILAAPKGNKKLVKEVVENGINIVLCPALPYIYKEERFWIQQFDVVLVNVFQMIHCACEISKIKPVMWWIHEYSEIYGKTLERFRKEISWGNLDKPNIYAVSHVAKDNFNLNFPGRVQKLLPYGIPDRNESGMLKRVTHNLVFAIIGVVCPIKAQDIFLQAVSLLKSEEKQNVQFWIIGYIGTDKYSSQVKEFSAKDKSIKVTGELTRSEMYEVYSQIDVVVCPSREDSLPLVITEGMMYGKTCIVSDVVGTRNYINDKENGIVCKKEDARDLCEKIKWAISNKENLCKIGEKARQTYERFFSMEVFGEKLEKAIQDTVNNSIHKK